MLSAASGALMLPGLVLGHLLAYALAYPSAEERAHHLDETGHEAFALLTVAALLVLPAVLGFVAARTVRAGCRLSLTRIASRLAVLQIAGFVCLEGGERGLDLAATVTDPAVLVGAAIQIPLAVGIAQLLGGVIAGVQSLATRHELPPLPTADPRLLRPWSGPDHLRSATFRRSVAPRGPPAALPA